jgi:hypothetical protein
VTIGRRGELEHRSSEKALTCANCSLAYPIETGLPDMTSPRPWVQRDRPQREITPGRGALRDKLASRNPALYREPQVRR